MLKEQIGKVEFKVETVDFKASKPVKVHGEPPVKVKKNDVFNIPEGYAHCLKNTGSKPLLISFICLKAHLGEDRFIVENP